MYTESLIVIVTYNSQDFIENCLYSVAGQSYNDWFLVVVDNNSIDNTIKRIEHYRDTRQGIDESNFKLISLKRNIGFSGAVDYAVFNFMPEEKKDLEKELKYLILLNPDIYLKKDALRRLISTFKETKDRHKQFNETGVAGGLILDYKKDIIQHLGGRVGNNFITSHIGQGEDYRKNKINKGRLDSVTDIRNVDYVTGAFFATEFGVFKSMGGFDQGYRPLYFEELDYCLKIKRTGKKVVVNYDSVARHFEGASIEKFSKNFYKYYHKNRIRCAVINVGILDFLKKFIRSEMSWLRNKATADQITPILYAYFLNLVFLPYNLIIKIKNHLILNKLELK
jgi:GT2 family glycosyltransferase